MAIVILTGRFATVYAPGCAGFKSTLRGSVRGASSRPGRPL